MSQLKNLRAVAMRLLAKAGLTGLLLLGLSGGVHAGNINVTTASDSSVVQCTLRDAITAANTDLSSNGCGVPGSGTDTISLPAGIYSINSILPWITTPIILTGAGAGSTIIRPAAPGYSALLIDANPGSSNTGSLTLSGVTITGFDSGVSAYPTISANGPLIATNVNVLDNINDQGYTAGIDGDNQYGSLTLNNVTSAGNQSKYNAGISAMNGGTFNNVTVYNNTTAQGAGGLTLDGLAGGTFSLVNTTVAGNQATSTAAGLNLFNAATVTAKNVLLNRNLVGATSANCDGIHLPTATYSLSSDATCSLSGIGNVNNTDAGLGAFGDNGGNVQTVALGRNSAAIDAGTATGAPATDARGSARVNGTDIGAFEFDLPSTPVYRFWSPKFNNDHFFTTSILEKNALMGDVNWHYEGVAYYADDCTAGHSSVYRFWSPRFNDSHFFTGSPVEKNALMGDTNWRYEGVAFCADAASTPTAEPVYRYWSPKFNNVHFFTTSTAEKNALAVDANWHYEGIGFYAW